MAIEERYKAAVAESAAYVRMGALDDTMIADIAHDHRVSAKKLKELIWA